MKDFAFPCLPEMPGRRLIDHIRDPVTDLLTGRDPGEFRVWTSSSRKASTSWRIPSIWDSSSRKGAARPGSVASDGGLPNGA
jgi:hypothetical protein